MGGERFTFMSRVDAKLSKLNRFPACSNFFGYFPLNNCYGLVLGIIRSLPNYTNLYSGDFGPPSFKEKGRDKEVESETKSYKMLGLDFLGMATLIHTLQPNCVT